MHASYTTFAGFSNAVDTLAMKLNLGTRVPSSTVLRRLFARCLTWGFDALGGAESVIRRLLDGTLPKRFSNRAMNLARMEAELASVNAQIAAAYDALEAESLALANQIEEALMADLVDANEVAEASPTVANKQIATLRYGIALMYVQPDVKLDEFRRSVRVLNELIEQHIAPDLH